MKSVPMTEPLYAYLVAHGTAEAPILRALREQTQRHPQATMQVPAEEGALLAFLARAAGVRRYLEVGVFTGYSALAVAMAMPDEGRITGLDVSEEFTNIGKSFWQKAEVAHKIDLRLAPALRSMQTLLDEGKGESFDMVFIDANKDEYPQYYELALKLCRQGGLILLDNVLWGGEINDARKTDPQTIAMRKVNDVVASDARVFCVMLPVSDGITLAIKH